jgi:hypothetical protein
MALKSKTLPSSSSHITVRLMDHPESYCDTPIAPVKNTLFPVDNYPKEIIGGRFESAHSLVSSSPRNSDSAFSEPAGVAHNNSEPIWTCHLFFFRISLSN